MLLSPFAAARELELDRQTVERMLRGVRPDGYSKGTKQPRYRMKTLVDALERHRAKPDSSDTCSPEVQEMWPEFERLDAHVRAARSKKEACARLPALFSHLVALITAMDEDSRAVAEVNGEHRIKVFRTTVLWTLREVTGLSFEELVTALNKVTDGDSDHDG